MRIRVVVLSTLVTLLAANAASAAVMCRMKSGVVVIREACRRREKAVDLKEFGALGPTGPAGAAGGLVDTLPSGRTLTGTFAVHGFAVPPMANNGTVAAVTFQVPLAFTPTAHVVGFGDTPPVECPGNAVSPAAVAGHLCVYEGGQVANDSPTVRDPTRPNGTTVSPHGFLLSLTPAFGGTDFGYGSWGTWAVTAP